MEGAQIYAMIGGLGDAYSDAYKAAQAAKQEEAAPAIIEGLFNAQGGRASDAFTANYRQPAAASAAGPVAPAFAATGGGIGDYLAQTRARESGGNDLAANPNSSAKGRYQFTDQTWAGVAKRHPDLGLTPGGWSDPAQQEKAMQAFTADNAQALTRAGLPINPANLYGSHFLGEAGGPKFLAGALQNPDQPAIGLVSPGAARANRSVFFEKDGRPKTAGQVYSWMGGSQPSAAPATTPTLSVASAEPDAANMPTEGAQNAGLQIPGEAPAAPATPTAQGGSGFGSGGSRLAPEMRTALTAAWKNPNTRSVAVSIMSSMLQGKDANYQLGTIGDQPVIFDTKSGKYVAVGEKKSDPTSEQRNFEQTLKDPRFQAYLDAQRRPLTPTVVSQGQTVLPPGEYSAPSFVAPPKSEAFTLSAGQTRYENGQPVASAPDRDKTNEGEAKLRGEFTKQLGSFGEVQDGYRRLIAATEQREANPNSVSPASDIGLIFGYMKMLDPGSVVREGEYATAQNAAGIPTRIQNAYNKALSGEFLTPDQRQDFVDTAGRLYGQARQGAESVAGRYRDLAKGQGLDEGRVVQLPDALVGPKVAKKAEAQDPGKPVAGGRPPSGYSGESFLAKAKTTLATRPDLKSQLQKMLAESGIDPARLDK